MIFFSLVHLIKEIFQRSILQIQKIDSLYSWSNRGGKLIIGSGVVSLLANYDASVLNSKWGFSYTHELPSGFIPTPIGLSTAIFNGPFGNITVATQGGAGQGYFHQIPTNSTVLATNANGGPTLVMDCNTLDLIIADVDGYTSLGNGYLWSCY